MRLKFNGILWRMRWRVFYCIFKILVNRSAPKKWYPEHSDRVFSNVLSGIFFRNILKSGIITHFDTVILSFTLKPFRPRTAHDHSIHNRSQTSMSVKNVCGRLGTETFQKWKNPCNSHLEFYNSFNFHHSKDVFNPLIRYCKMFTQRICQI